MRVICIDDDGVYLTVGKEYEVISENNGYIAVVNDIGSVSEYSNKHFK